MGEDLLHGSGDHHGSIRREGDRVSRPIGAHSASVHSLLGHLAAVGFDGAPRVLAVDATREVLSFIDGEVPVPPEPPAGGWLVVSDRRVASVAGLLRRFHEAAASFVPDADAGWQGGGHTASQSMICHNDPVVGNIVFRGVQAVALIDFDYAGPNDPLRDLAIAAQHWIPLADPADFVQPPTSWSPTRRLDLMCQAYQLPPSELDRMLDLAEDYLSAGRQGVLARVRDGQDRFVAYWEAGLGDRLDRALTWLRRERWNLLAG